MGTNRYACRNSVRDNAACKASEEVTILEGTNTSLSAPPLGTLLSRRLIMQRTDYGTVSAGIIAGMVVARYRLSLAPLRTNPQCLGGLPGYRL
jgi:hypothetical protein